MGKMYVLNGKGHSTVTWSPTIEEEKRAAVEEFERLIKEGCRAFEVETPTKLGGPLERFDPDVEEIVMIFPMAGGSHS